MPRNQFNLFEDDARKMMDGLRKQYAKGFSADMDRAAEILQQEYLRLLGEAAVNGITGILKNANVTVKYKRKYKDVPRSIKVFIPDEGGGMADIVFNVLNSGRAALGDAQNHVSEEGKPLKVWPMALPRKVAFGNSPMTKGGSPNISLAYSHEPMIYRRYQNTPIKPRNFVKLILERTARRLEQEGLDYIDIELSEQD